MLTRPFVRLPAASGAAGAAPSSRFIRGGEGTPYGQFSKCRSADLNRVFFVCFLFFGVRVSNRTFQCFRIANQLFEGLEFQNHRFVSLRHALFKFKSGYSLQGGAVGGGCSGWG